MSQYDLMKLFARYDSEISEGDFTPEELEEYLAFCEGHGVLLPFIKQLGASRLNIGIFSDKV